MLRSVVCLALFALPLTACTTSGAIRTLGRDYTTHFYAGKTDKIWQAMTMDMKQGPQSLERFQAYHHRVQELLGREIQVLDEKVFQQDGLNYYRRTAYYERSERAFLMQWGINAGGQIADFVIRTIPPAQSVFYETKTPLRLPFSGVWYVRAGGRTLDQNHHHYDYSNRFAYDLRMAQDEQLDMVLPSHNEAFATWGQPVLAPAPGEVAAVESGIDDHKPGEIHINRPMGNYVVIDHKNGEYSVLACLMKRSITVRPGDQVRAGQILGRVGNSGYAPVPYLHYNLQNIPTPNVGVSLPAQFVDYIADGHLQARGELFYGQTIQQNRDSVGARP